MNDDNILKNELISSVKKICDKLRTVMEVNEYRNYVLGFLFYKYLSEKIEQEVQAKEKDFNYSYKEINFKNQEYKGIIDYIIKYQIGFFLEYKYTFQHVLEMINEGKDIIETIEEAFKQIERSSEGTESEDDFKGLFKEVKLDDSKLGKIERDREETIKYIIKEFSKLHLSFNNNEDDIFGNAYEYLLSEFASDGGKKAGEFYTPTSISELIARIATHNKKDNFKTAYDPACGSGSLLLKLTKKTKKYNKIFGQEVKSSTFNLARMNLFLRGFNFSNFDIKEGDTLVNPKHLDEKKFECIVANPPFSLKWNPSVELESDIRYNQYPALAPKSKADFAFLQHMLYHVDPENGIIVSIFSLGILERGNAEYEIRKFIINKNYIDAIIALPSRMFFNTSIPSCIVVAKKTKKKIQVFYLLMQQMNLKLVKDKILYLRKILIKFIKFDLIAKRYPVFPK